MQKRFVKKISHACQQWIFLYSNTMFSSDITRSSSKRFLYLLNIGNVNYQNGKHKHFVTFQVCQSYSYFKSIKKNFLTEIICRSHDFVIFLYILIYIYFYLPRGGFTVREIHTSQQTECDSFTTLTFDLMRG